MEDEVDPLDAYLAELDAPVANGPSSTAQPFPTAALSPKTEPDVGGVFIKEEPQAQGGISFKASAEANGSADPGALFVKDDQ